MRLRRLDLTRYGHFTDRVLDFGQATPGVPDLHIVYGLNEAGKSTALSGYLDLIFGIEERSTYGFLHPYPTMEIGGAFDLVEGLTELRRTKQRASSLRRPSGEVVSEGIFGASLAGLTREQYRMMFCLDDDTLQAGGEAILESKGDVGQLLFAASAGLADLTRELAAIDSETDDLFRKRASSTAIAQLKHELADLKAKRDQFDTRASVYAALKGRREEAQQAYSGLSSERSRLRLREAGIRRTLQAIPIVQRVERLGAQVLELSALPRLGADEAKRIGALKTTEARTTSRIISTSKQIEFASSELTLLSVDERMLGQADRIRALATAIGQYQAAAVDLPKRRASLDEVNREIAIHLRNLGRHEYAPPSDVAIPQPIVQQMRALITKRAALQAALQAAQHELATAVEARDVFERLRTSRDDDGMRLDIGIAARISQTIVAIRDSDTATRLKLTVERLAIEEAKLGHLVAQLGPAGADLGELRSFSCPSAGEFDRWTRSLGDIDRREQAQRSRLTDRLRERAEWTARIESVQERLGSADDKKAAALRRERDAALALLIARLDRDSADAFAGKLREDDAMSELRLALATDVALLRQYEENLSSIDAATEVGEKALAQIAHEEAELSSEIAGTAPKGLANWESALGAGSRLERLRAWVDQRAAVLEIDLVTARLDAERRMLAAEMEAHRESLRTWLQRAGIAVIDPELGALVSLAEQVLRRSEEMGRRSEEDANQALSLAEAARGRQVELEKAGAAYATWQDDWSHSVSMTWLAQTPYDPSVVASMLNHVEAISVLVDKAEDLKHRIGAMENDQSDLTSRLTAVLETLDQSATDPDPIAEVGRLMKGLEEAQKASAARSARLEALQRHQDDFRQAQRDQEILAREVAEVLAVTGATTLDEASALAERCAVRDRLENERDEAISHCLIELQLAGFGEVRQLVAGADRAALQQELDTLEARLEPLNAKVEEAFAQLSQADREIEAIDGDDVVARLEVQRRTVLLQLEQAALRYARLKAGSHVASRAIRSYRDAHRSGMMAQASEAFAAMTCGAYPSLATRPEKDKEVLIGLPRAGGSRRASDMSKGTRFQLYLALRLAAYHEAAALRPPVPFIADDIMETFDEPRSEAVIRLLGEASLTGQIIYLTHHRHLCEIARDVVSGVRLHHL